MLPPALVDAALAGVFGLLIGSFLNVVIYRMPKIMERDWQADYAEMQGTELPPAEPFNLWVPRSRCQACGHQIRWYENIPVVSYLALRGKCSSCQTRISPRYPLIELAVGLLFAVCGWRWGISLTAAAWAVFASILVAQFWIDFDTQYLPDDLNYLLLWLGLLVAAMGWTVPLPSAVWGAALGYLSLWSVHHAFLLLTGKIGMGNGDFKLLAAICAWFGADYLLAIIIMSSVVGSILGIILLLVGKIAHKDIYMPFGPYLAGAGLLILVIGPAELRAMVPFIFPFAAR
ncbi:MAG: prepilin peptidase [Burkholderiales bacterium]|nr:MAG: prepilin peptidase [Burkholderiales bacterium]